MLNVFSMPLMVKILRAKSRMAQFENFTYLGGIPTQRNLTKLCMPVGVQDTITHAKFGNDRLRGYRTTLRRVEFSIVPYEWIFAYNTVARLCYRDFMTRRVVLSVYGTQIKVLAYNFSRYKPCINLVCLFRILILFAVTITIGTEAVEQAVCEGNKVQERLSFCVQDGTNSDEPREQRSQQF